MKEEIDLGLFNGCNSTATMLMHGYQADGDMNYIAATLSGVMGKSGAAALLTALFVVQMLNEIQIECLKMNAARLASIAKEIT